MKIVRIITLTLLLLITAAAAGLYFFLNSEFGLHYTLNALKQSIPGEIQYQSASGTLHDTFTINNIHISHKDFTGDIKSLKLSWNPYALLQRKIDIQNLEFDTIKLIPNKNFDPKTLFTSKLHPSFPWKFSLNKVFINNIDVESNDGTVILKGDISTTWNLQWYINRATFKSEGTITGTLLHPAISAKLQADTLDIKNIISTQPKVNISANIDFIQKAITLNNLSFSTQEVGKWVLESPTIIKQNKINFEFSKFCFKHDQNHFCVNGTWQTNSNYTLDILGNEIPLAWIGPTLHPDLNLYGKFDINAHIKGSKALPPTGNIQVKLHPGKIAFPIDLNTKSFNYVGGTIAAELSPETLKGNVTIDFVEGSKLKGSVEIPKFNWAQPLKQDIKGTLNWQFPSIAFLQPLIPNISNLDGRLSLNYQIEGTLESPEIQGHSTLADAHFNIPKLNVHFKNIQGEGTIKNNELTATLNSNTENSEIKILAKTEINKSLKTSLSFIGKNVQVINTNGVQVFASPNLTMDINENLLSLQGKIDIPKAKIAIEDYSDTTTLPEEVVIVNQDSTSKETQWQISSDVELTLGDKIYINGKGLKGKLEGQLRITDSPNSTTLANGILSITEGKYKFYSTDLKIETGNLMFTDGPINNPGLNIKAVRQFEGTQSSQSTDPALKVGINVAGTLNKPEIHLFSIPNRYDESDILSFLLLGQPLQQAGQEKANLLLSAASALDIGGDGKLSNIRNQIKDKLGLSVLDLTSQTEYNKKTKQTIQHTALVLGKYLSPKLYIGYSFDVLDHTNSVQLRYWLNTNWSIQTESRGPDSSGVDLLYSIERK